MSKKFKRIISIVLCLTMLISVYSTFATTSVAAANRTISNNEQWVKTTINKGTGYAPYGIDWTTYVYKINGSTAYCLQPANGGASGSDIWCRYTEVGNDNLKKAVYYYEKGDLTSKIHEIRKNYWLWTKNYNSYSSNDTGADFILIHYAMAYIYDSKSNWSNGLTSDWINGVKELVTYINGKANLADNYKVYYAIPRDDSKQILLVSFKTTIKITKTDSVTNNTLKGAKFNITFDDGTRTLSRGTFTTGSDGTVTSNYLPPGRYRITETTAPTGYEKNTTPKYVTIDATGGASTVSSQSVSFTNKPYIKLQVQKKSSNLSLSYSLSGAVYTIYTNRSCTGTAFGTIKINSDGKGVYGSGTNGSDVAYGTYYAKETTAPKGYALDSTIYQFKDSGKTADGVKIYSLNGTTGVSDTPYIKLQLLKSSANCDLTDDNNCYSLEGAVYNIYTNSNCVDGYVGYMETDADGYGCFGSGEDTNTDSNDKSTAAYKENSGKDVSLKNGVTYYCKEYTAPKGYDKDDTVYIFKNSGSLTSNGINIYRAYSTDTGEQPSDNPIDDPIGIVLQKRNAVTGETVNQGLEDAVFEIQYYAQEIDKDYDIDISNSDTAPALDANNLKRTWYFKTDNDGYTELTDNTNYFINYGMYLSDDLYYREEVPDPIIPIGTIVIKEVEAPQGYTISNTVFYRRITADGAKYAQDTNTPIEIPIDEQPANGYIGLRKMNTYFQLVAGATYGLFENNNCGSDGMINVSPVATVVTTDGTSDGYIDEDGNFYQVFKDGSGNDFAAQIDKIYYIQEISNPIGYSLDKNIYEVSSTIDNLTPETAIVQEVFEDTKVGDILIHKDSNDGVVADMWFSVEDSNGKQYKAVATDKDGNAKVTGLPLYDSNGNKLAYTVKELGFKVTNTTFSYGGYTWTIDTTQCIRYQGILYEGVANPIYKCSDPSVPTYSRYYYGDSATAVNNQNIGITQDLTENGIVTYNFVNNAKTVDAEIYKSTFDGAEKNYSIDFEVFDQFNNSYGVIRARNGYGTTTKGVPEYGRTSTGVPIQGVGKTMFASMVVPNTSVYVPLNYKVKELGFVTPTTFFTSYFFPDSYEGLAVSELKKSDAINNVFTLTYSLVNKPDVGNINISKSSEDGEISGLCFELSAWSDYECTDEDYLGFDSNGYYLHSIILKTDEDGYASTKDVEIYDSNGNLLGGICVYSLMYTAAEEDGTIYRVRELGFDNGDGTYTLPKRYKTMEDKIFTLGKNREVTYECVNEIKTSSLQVQKTSEDNIVSDMWFSVKSDYNLNPLDTVVVTDENGLSEVLEDLPVYQGGIGSEDVFVNYTVEELGIKVYDDGGNWTGEYKIPNRYDKSRIKPSTVTLKDYETIPVKIVKKNNYSVRGNVNLHKVDTNGNGLYGSEWQLYKVEENNDDFLVGFVQTGTSSYQPYETPRITTMKPDNSGNLYIYNLSFGSYYLVETKAPEGYNSYGDKIYFSIIADDETVSLSYDFTVKNTKQLLPNTGDIGVTPIYIIGAAFFVAAIGTIIIYFKNRQKHKREDK